MRALACATLIMFAGAAAAQPRALDPALPAYQPQAAAPAPHAGYLDADGAVRIAGAEHVQYIVERFNRSTRCKLVQAARVAWPGAQFSRSACSNAAASSGLANR